MNYEEVGREMQQRTARRVQQLKELKQYCRDAALIKLLYILIEEFEDDIESWDAALAEDEGPPTEAADPYRTPKDAWRERQDNREPVTRSSHFYNFNRPFDYNGPRAAVLDRFVFDTY